MRIAIASIACSVLLLGCGKDSNSLLRSVQDLEAKRDYAAAIAALAGAVRSEPENSGLRYHLARLHSLAFDWPAAESEFRKAARSGLVEGGRVALGLGRALYQQRRYEEVVTDVAPAAAFENEVLASVHALRGHALMSLDRIADARQELKAAEKLAPGCADAVLLQTRFQAEGRDVRAALDLIEKLLVKDPANIEGWLHRADLLILLGKPRDALESFGKVLELHPRHLHALIGRSMALVQIGRLVHAEEDVDTLRKTYPKKPVSAYLRGQIYYWRGEYREALDMAQAMLKSEPENGPARLLSGMAHLMLDATAQAEHELARYLVHQPRDAAVRRVLADLRSGTSQGARSGKALASAHADELRKASVQALYGDTYIRAWRYSKAADWLVRLAGAALPDPLIAVRQAQRRFSQEQLELAAADLERIAMLNEDGKAAHAALVLLHLARGDTVRALEYASAMEQGPTAAMLAGIALMERNQREEAGRRFDEALQGDPKLMAAVLARARLDLTAGKPDLARKRFQDVLGSEPDHLQALVIYALFEERARRHAEAHGLLQRAIKAHPKALEPKAVLIGLLRKENAKARALEVAEEMLADHPRDPIAIELAADIQLWNGNRERGLSTLERLVAVLPRSAESFFKLASAQFNAGRAAQAEANLRKALSLPIDDPEMRALPVSGLFDDTKTLLAIESTRKSYKPSSDASHAAHLHGDLWSPQGGSTLYDALSGQR